MKESIQINDILTAMMNLKLGLDIGINLERCQHLQIFDIFCYFHNVKAFIYSSFAFIEEHSQPGSLAAAATE
jgi:hypothetical protein